MPRWADRAKAAMQRGERSLQTASLEETRNQAQTILGDIQFVMESSGASIEPIELTAAGLNLVEAFYRSAIRDGAIELGGENFERMMAVMLGQCIIATNGGKWFAYEGNHYVVDPVVVQLGSGEHVDVFMFCKSLSQKPGVAGASRGQALSSFVENVDRVSFT